MGNGKSAVITVYGHEKAIDKFSISFFDKTETGQDRNADAYCDTINRLELKDGSWICAKILSENTQYTPDDFCPVKFDIILNMDDRSIQKVLREVDCQELAKSLKGESEAVKEKIFRNMSKRAAVMLTEDMEYMGPILKADAVSAQEKIIQIIRILAETGEIVFTPKGEIVV